MNKYRSSIEVLMLKLVLKHEYKKKSQSVAKEDCKFVLTLGINLETDKETETLPHIKRKRTMRTTFPNRK